VQPPLEPGERQKITEILSNSAQAHKLVEIKCRKLAEIGRTCMIQHVVDVSRVYKVVQKSGHPYCFSSVRFCGPPCS